MKLITETIENIEVLTEERNEERLQDKRYLYASGY